jgi:predicted RND superfamily exporter protein
MKHPLHSILTAWHRVATRRPWLIYAILLVECVIASAICFTQARMDADIRHLFSETDPVIQELQAVAPQDGAVHALYIRLAPLPEPQSQTLGAQLEALPHVASLIPLPAAPTPSENAHTWLQLSLAHPIDAAQREQAVNDVRRILDASGSDYGLTGADVVMQEFKHSIWRDFGTSSAMSLLLVCAVVAIGYRMARGIWIGLLCELGGLLVGLALFLSLGGELNLLSATVPCVLLGLGIDFVIHSVSAATRTPDQPEEEAGMRVYRDVMTPMFWGALTTSLAFFSLCLARLSGLTHVGMLGGIGMLSMFLHVLLLLPPALTRSPPRATPITTHIQRLVPRRHPIALGLVLALLCMGIAPFAKNLRMEERIDKMYDPSLPSLTTQNELAQRAGTYPSTVFASFSTTSPDLAIQALAAPDQPFLLAGATRTPTPTGTTAIVATLAPRQNPFLKTNWDQIQTAISHSLAPLTPDALIITGDPRLTFHLNHLLSRGVSRALALTCGILLAVLLIVFRRPTAVIPPIAMFLLALAGTAGLLGILNVSMSAYTLSLFPLFIGIGMDDCFHVGHVLGHNRPLRNTPHVLLAVTMTTLTTMAGYGSLMAARNPGFQDMGRSAIIGLGMMYIGAVWMLPAFFQLLNKRKVPSKQMETRS